MDVGPEGIVGIDELLTLCVARVAGKHVLADVSLFAINFRQLRLEIVNLEFKLLQLVLKSISFYSCFLLCLLCTLDEHIDVLHHVVFLRMRLDLQLLF